MQTGSGRAALLLLLLLLSCGGPAQTPEDRVRAVLAALEEGAEAGDAAAMKEHVSETYQDAEGRDRQALGGLVAFHLLQNRSVHLLTRVAAVELPAPGEAHARVMVAMAAAPIPSAELLPALRADLYRFDLRFRDEDGAWRLVEAAFRPASLEDFR